ncbi:hypothetical protein [Microbacterium gilvum]|uniref:Uncharacterized protein n=1 Tax=Microbacterium gilvum TaxID=1336204 RepID=A0ABP9AHR7_9MICO
MDAPTGTIVAVVGPGADDVLASVDALGGVSALALRGSEPAIASHRIAAAGTPWVVHDADPLEHVAAAWIELFEERSTLGALEAEIGDALARFARGDALMPDYYLVLEPDDAPEIWRHWWCGALGHRAPRRVVPVKGEGTAGRMLRALPSSRPWPDPASWLPGLSMQIPDRVGLRDREFDRRE